jgi:hypothetical protein
MLVNGLGSAGASGWLLMSAGGCPVRGSAKRAVEYI